MLGPDVEPQPDAVRDVTTNNVPTDQVRNRIARMVGAMRDPRQGTPVTRCDAFRPCGASIAQIFCRPNFVSQRPVLTINGEFPYPSPSDSAILPVELWRLCMTYKNRSQN